MTDLILSIDQGTTSSRAIVFDPSGAIVSVSQYEFTQHYPADGWVEHDPEEIWATTLRACRDVLDQCRENGTVVAAGITNQRETTVIWDRESGKPIYNAIVWQDRRTADRCQQLQEEGVAALVSERTGLLLDAYFSGTKIGWILDHVDGARERARQGKLAFGTIDTFLLWRLTGGASHKTDATNASRTMLFDIHRQCWDEELLKALAVPVTLLPDVLDCAADFGTTDSQVLGASIPLRGVAGDQQAALVGQACFGPGMVKSTYGTGCFMVMNTGDTAVRSHNRLLTTVGYRLEGRTTYALEGSIFNAGTAIQWLRDGIGVFRENGEIDSLLASTGSNAGVYMVPAFTGMGAPHWNPHARGSITGITRDTGPAQLVRAALEAVCYQTLDLTRAMAADSGATLEAVRVDGGMVVNDWLVQFLSDILDVPVERPAVVETTALGAAYLAGLGAGLFENVDALADHWKRERRFTPEMYADHRNELIVGWNDALGRTLETGRQVPA